MRHSGMVEGNRQGISKNQGSCQSSYQRVSRNSQNNGHKSSQNKCKKQKLNSQSIANIAK